MKQIDLALLTQTEAAMVSQVVRGQRKPTRRIAALLAEHAPDVLSAQEKYSELLRSKMVSALKAA
jgi:hypothetical protein